MKRLLRAAYGTGAPAPAGAAAPPAQDLAKAAVLEPAFAKRFDAAMALRKAYGERAVPCLLPHLRGDVEPMVNAHVTLVSRIGQEAVLPLAAAVRTEELRVRELVAQELGAIGDVRALPVLLELKEAEGPQGPSRVARAAEKLSRDPNRPGTAVGGYLDLARRYFEGDRCVARLPCGQPTLLWGRNGDDLVGRPVDRHLYLIELGKQAATDALRLDPESNEARDLLDRFRASEELARNLVANR